MPSVKADAVIVRATNGRAIQAPTKVWLDEIIELMTPQQRDTLFQRVEGRMGKLILRPALVPGDKMVLRKPMEV